MIKSISIIYARLNKKNLRVGWRRRALAKRRSWRDDQRLRSIWVMLMPFAVEKHAGVLETFNVLS
jgi:hypothetical protein